MKQTPFFFLIIVSALLLSACDAANRGDPAGEPDTGCWAEVTSPTLGEFDAEIGGIAAVSGTDIWAVGWQTTAVGGSKTLTMRWDGTRWAFVPSPNVGEGGQQKNQLYAVAAYSSDGAWAVGAYTDNRGFFRNLAMRWDGKAWTIESPPSPGLIENSLNGVDTLGGSDVWAVGTSSPGEGKDPQMAIFRWSGSQWSQALLPETGSHNLLAVKAISREDVWAAGTEVLHWDGTEWRRVATPVSNPGGYFDGILATVPNDVWVTGNDGNEAIAFQWNGTGWSGGNTPKLGDGPFPHDIAALAPDDIWIAGEYSDSPAYSLPMLLRWDGKSWRTIANPLPGRAARLQSLTVADGTLWAAGTQQDAKSSRPLFLRRTAAPCAGAKAP